LVLTLLGGWLLVSVLASCKKDPPKVDDPLPFVRLLKDQQFKSNILKRNIDYAVLLPVEYEKSTDSFPVVYLLHGFGDNETAWITGGLIQYYTDQNAASTVPMIYVMPVGFNSYYVNKYNGQFPYMDMFVDELVPLVDSLFRTKPDPNHRAVMGYSMGGYGAMIMPVKNPDVFKTGIALSMSFRTNEQYLGEPQSVFDYQWGPIFGGSGMSGEARFTDYYKHYSPFQFLQNPDDQSMNGLNLFFDCGDDEESLSETNNLLHSMLRDRSIQHEYRMRSGYHGWDYWKKSLPEALKYISYAVQQKPYPIENDRIDYGVEISSDKILLHQVEASEQIYRVVLPPDYGTTTIDYPVILVFHEEEINVPPLASNKILSLLNNQIIAAKLPASIVVEVPVGTEQVDFELIQNIISQFDNEYRTSDKRDEWIAIGNNSGGRPAFDLVSLHSEKIHACLLFDALLPENPEVTDTSLTYYLDITDEGLHYKSNNELYLNLRKNEVPYEYRVRQGLASDNDFLNGIFEAISFINKNLKS
jgi:S-formylglutathione hydrolase FrmB